MNESVLLAIILRGVECLGSLGRLVVMLPASSLAESAKCFIETA